MNRIALTTTLSVLGRDIQVGDQVMHLGGLHRIDRFQAHPGRVYLSRYRPARMAVSDSELMSMVIFADETFEVIREQ